MTRASVARRGSWIGAIGALVVLTVGAGLESGCSGGREARLQEVLRRSRAAPETISSIEKPFLLDPEPDVRALAVWAIGDARAPDAVEVLSPLAKDPAPVVRLAVVRALCPISPTSAPEAVLALVQDSDGETRRAAVRCVAAKGEPAPGVLAVALGDGDKDVRLAALEGLRRRPQREAMEPLLAAVTARAPDEQLAAVAALRALHDPAAVPALEKAAAERLSPPVRDAVEAAIVDLRGAVESPPGAPAPKAAPPSASPAAPGKTRKPPLRPAAGSKPDATPDASLDRPPDATGEGTANEAPAPSPEPPPPRGP